LQNQLRSLQRPARSKQVSHTPAAQASVHYSDAEISFFEGLFGFDTVPDFEVLFSISGNF